MITEKGANIVFDCTVPEAHTDITLEALQHGCHVLGEKPMAMSMDRAAMMIEAAQASGKIYAVIQNRRYADPILRFRNFVQSGQIGRLHTLNADFYLGPHFGGFREEMAHVLLIDMAIHSFDQARFISGADPVAVYCYEWNPPGSWYSQDASAMAIFEMSDGLIFNYRGSWCAEGLNTSWECAWRAQAERGSATWDGHEQFEAQAVAGSEGFMREQKTLEFPPLPPLAQTGHGGVIYEFLNCIQNGGTPQTICTDNIKSLAMVHAAVESAETDQRIVIKTT
jgi:predicted dehydrogenase